MRYAPSQYLTFRGWHRETRLHEVIVYTARPVLDLTTIEPRHLQVALFPESLAIR
jgi:hypothetical protein